MKTRMVSPDFKIAHAMDKAQGLHFNLDQMDMELFRQFARNPVLGHENITNWELYRILSREALWQKTTFYGEGGVVVGKPYLP